MPTNKAAKFSASLLNIPSGSCRAAEAVKLHKAGVSTKALAQACGVHLETVRLWIRKDRKGESLARKPGSGRRSKLSASNIRTIQKLAAQPEFCTAERAATEFSRVGPVSISKSTAWRALRRAGNRYEAPPRSHGSPPATSALKANSASRKAAKTGQKYRPQTVKTSSCTPPAGALANAVKNRKKKPK